MKKVRPIIIEGDVAYITLTKGYTAIIDTVDVPLVEGYNWYSSVRKTNNTVYARRSQRTENGVKPVMMHRVIMNLSDEEYVDHKDHDGLNNRRYNLRVCNTSENQQNTRIRVDTTSGYKGVSWHKQKEKWDARITLAGNTFFIGSFDSPEDAHIAYCEASEKYHNEFGHTG